MTTVLSQPATKEDAARSGMPTTPDHWRETLDTCEQLELLRPGDAAVVFYKGRALGELGREEDALAAFQRALQLDPSMVSAHEQLCMIFRERGETAAALRHLGHAARLNPADPHLHLAIGDIHREWGDIDTAITHWRRAIDIDSHFTPALHCLGVALDHQNHLEEALDCHRRVAEQMPDLSENHRYLAMTQTDMGLLDDALASAERALQLTPESAEARWQRFFIRALRGDFPGAWEDYECRFQLKNRTTPQLEFSQPRWQGEPLAGRTLLIHAEQGFGDTLQMARYLPLAARRGGRVLLWCPPALAPLMRGMLGVEQVLSELDHTTRFDCHLPMMSLPGLFKATLDNLPSNIPYLDPPGPEICPLPSSPAGTLRVGLAWDGSHSQPIDRRSVPLEALEPLLDIPGISLYSLQVGPAAQALRDRGWDKKIIDLSPRLADFRATAATVAQLDLVLSLDSAVAHLAGALGQPTWLMLSATPDWRWRHRGDNNPWYPTLRIFRQAKAGDWNPVITEIGHALRQQTSSNEGMDDKTRLLLSLRELDGEPQAARALIEAYLKQHPSTADIWNLLGTTCFDLGQLDAAIAAFATALKFQPNYPEALYNQGNTHYTAGHYDDARTTWQKALKQDPQISQANYNLGLLSQEQGRLNDAVGHYQRELEIDPHHADAGLNLGEILREAGRLDEAIAHLQQFRKLHPRNPGAATNLAAVLTLTHRLQEACETCREAVALDPQSPRSWNNLGAIHYRRCDYDSSREAYEKALALDTDHADARYNLSLHQLLHGDYKNGFENYSARWRTNNPIFTRRLPFPLPLWCGEPLGSKPLLVLAEQGQGDMIQFARLLPGLAQRGIRVVLQCQESLHRLLEPLPAVTRVVPKDNSPSDCAACCPLMDLPRLLGITLDHLPSASYLPKIRPADLPPATYRVGLAWAGNPEHSLDRERSLADPALLRPLLDVQGIRFFSLQVDRPPLDDRVADLRGQINDFADTAAVVTSLDLVIAVDTAVAHLAAALGRPTWVLLPKQPDWRWLLDRADSPWYPSLTLFRQQQAGDWAGVLDRLATALARFGAR